MSIKVIDGDLFDATAPIICHQVNCQGKMGSGVAKQVRAKCPVAYRQYIYLCNDKKPSSELLGHAQFVYGTDKIVVNMFAQDRYGYDGRRYTDYPAFACCLREIAKKVAPGETIAMPYNIGCGLAGGDWNVVYSLIEKILGQQYNVELWRKEG